MRRAALLGMTVLLAVVPGAGRAGFVDAVVGEVEGRVVTASDVALARALGVFDLAPSDAPIDAAAIDRMLNALLVVAEAQRLRIGEAPDEVEAAWRTAAERSGGVAALETWLARVAVEPARARALVADDTRYRRFIALRFREFVFVTPEEVALALGPGEHPADAEERVRERLRTVETETRLRAWLEERRPRASIRRVLDAAARVPNPFPMPPRPPQ